MGIIVLDILNEARKHFASTPSAKWFDPRSDEPSDTQAIRIAELLRPNFEFFDSPQSRDKRRKEELKLYTEEQFEALDAMESNPRIIFSGPAGTGKTLLAIELARRKSLCGKRVLLLCFNRLLGNWLQDETSTLKPFVKTTTIHSYMLSLANTSPQNNGDSFWDSTLPKLAKEALLNKENKSHIYDVVIVDEAQDLISEINLDFIDQSLNGGFSSGNWYFFGDFERQAIYLSDTKDIVHSRLSHAPKFFLRVNCRNTPRIAEFIHILGGLNPRYSRVRRPDNLIEPEIQLFSDHREQAILLTQILEKLVKIKKYSGKNIVILSPYSDTKSIANAITGQKDISVKPIYSLHSEDDIAFCSTHSFKGLEAPVIIITDIEDVISEHAKSLFYIAITRALDKLIILVNENTRHAMLEAISSKL